MGGGHTLVRSLRGLVACSPIKFFIFNVGLWPNSGGGGGTQAGGGKSQCAPPPLYATLQFSSVAPCLFVAKELDGSAIREKPCNGWLTGLRPTPHMWEFS